MNDIVTCVSDYRRGLDWMIGFVNTLQVVSTNNYYTIADFHTTNHSTLSLLNLLSLGFHNGYSYSMFSLDVSW
jgi:hypothetical protein